MSRLAFIGGAPLHCPTLERYWADARPFEAERAAKFSEHDAAMAAHDRRLRERQEAIWAREGQGA